MLRKQLHELKEEAYFNTSFEQLDLILQAHFMLIKKRLRFFVFNLPHLILTPSGVMFDRRHHRRFYFPERRWDSSLRRFWINLEMLTSPDDDSNPMRS